MLEGSEDAIVGHKSVFLDKSMSMKARGGRKRLSRSEIWDGSPKMLSSSASSPPPTSPQVGAHPPPTPSEVVVSTSYAEMDAAYFHSYAHVGIHEEMIKVIHCIVNFFGGNFDFAQIFLLGNLAKTCGMLECIITYYQIYHSFFFCVEACGH